MGVGSFMANVAAGNVGGAALDAVGVILDSAATVTPCVPGGAGTAIKLLRGADKAADILKAADKANDIRKAADKANEVRKATDKAGDVAKAADKATDSGKSVGQKTARETTEQARSEVAKKTPHGNTLDDRPATLYEKYDKDGNFQKHGITKHEDPSKRYTKKQIDGGEVRPIERGPRSEMAKKERQRVETNPGPDNREPWAGKRAGQKGE